MAFLLLLSFPPKKTEAWICRKHLCFGKTLPDGSCSATTFMRLILAKEADPEDPPKAANNPSHRQRPIQRPIRRPSSVVAQGLQERAKKAQERHDEALKDPTLLTNTQFVDVADLSPTVLRAVTEVLGLQSMTEIQAKTWPVAIAGKSILGRARTGTGKVGFTMHSISCMCCALI